MFGRKETFRLNNSWKWLLADMIITQTRVIRLLIVEVGNQSQKELWLRAQVLVSRIK